MDSSNVSPFTLGAKWKDCIDTVLETTLNKIEHYQLKKNTVQISQFILYSTGSQH